MLEAPPPNITNCHIAKLANNKDFMQNVTYTYARRRSLFTLEPGMLPKYFKSIFWFVDFRKLSLEKDRDLILFQAFEKGRMEHLRYLSHRLGNRILYNFAVKNAEKFSRKSIVTFAKVLFS